MRDLQVLIFPSYPLERRALNGAKCQWSLVCVSVKTTLIVKVSGYVSHFGRFLVQQVAVNLVSSGIIIVMLGLV